MTRRAPSGVIGVVHLRAMPSDPGYESGGFDAVVDAAMRDAEALAAGGVTSCIVENFGSAPFRRGTPDDPVDPHVHALICRVVLAIGDDMQVGVNVLRNDAMGALGIAAACGAHFIRVNVLAGAYVTDQGVIQSDAARLLRYRKNLGAERVAILADVHVKHATPLAPTTLKDAVHDTSDRGGADGIIVSGSGTGDPTTLEDVRVARAASSVPLYIGSGVTADSISTLRPLVDGVIVGTATKVDGDVRNPVDATRVRAVVDAWEAAGG